MMSTKNTKKSEDKLELAEKIAKQSEKFTRHYDTVANALARVFRFFSAWFDRIIFNPKYSRLVAFGFAVLVFLAFSTEQVTSIAQAKTLSNVKVNAIYNREMYEVIGFDNTVEVNVIGDYGDIQMVDGNDIYVELNLMNLGEGTHQVDYVAMNVSSRVKPSIDPASAKVTIRIKETKTMELSYDFINLDKLGNQYVLGNVTLDTKDVTISASKETLSQVAFVKALIDVGDKTSTFTQEANIVAYNQKGELLESVTIIPRVVNATVEVSSPNKTVPIYTRFEGTIPESKAVESVEMDHEAITIYGPQSVLDAISDITVTIPATSLTAGKLTQNITLPSGVKHGSVSKINIDVQLGDAVTRTYDNISIIYRENVEGYKIRAINEEDFETSITVVGTQKNIDEFDPKEDIIVYLNMRDVEVGNNQELRLYVDSQSRLLTITPNKQTILVDIIK